MGAPPKKKPIKLMLAVIALLVIGLSGIAAVKVMPTIIFEQRLKVGLETMMKQPVDIGEGHITFDLSSGYARDIIIHNPEQYKGNVFLEVPRLTFELDTSQLSGGPSRFKHVTLHDPVLHLETLGETSNLKDMIELMLLPGGAPAPPVIIDTLRIENGKISALFEHGDGKPVYSEFPLEHIDNLEGGANEIAGQVALELQKTMDAQVKEAAKDINDGFINAIRTMFKRDK